MTIKADTKNILAASFEDLLKNKSFDSITVGDIIEHCGACRTTFYRHFKDKYDIMNWIFLNKSDEIFKRHTDISSFKDLLIEQMNNVIEKRTYFLRAIKSEEKNSLFECIYSDFLNDLIMLISKKIGVDHLPNNIVFSLELYSAGFVFMLKEWVNNGLKESVEANAEMFLDSIPYSLREYF